MIELKTTFELPSWIVEGLERREYVRIGGVIRDTKTKHIVAMLREIAPDISQASTLLTQAGSIASLLNLGVSILNLGVSVIGFALILKRLKEIEHNLEENLNKIKDNINHLHRKIDISVYANFRAALDLARDATTMIQPENRRNAATLAINRFLEAQHIYSNYVDISINEDINFAEKHILSLSLTYVARARCYLELEEIKNAVGCLQEGAKLLRCHIEKYVKHLLISQPIGKELPSFRGGPIIALDSPVELCRLAHICKWLEPELNNSSDDKSILFEAQGKNLVRFYLEDFHTNTGVEALIALEGAQVQGVEENIAISLLKSSLVVATSAFPIVGIPVAIGIVAGIAINMATQENSKQQDANYYTENQAIKQGYNSSTEEINSPDLFQIVENIEQIIETYNRFEAYLVEVQVIQQLGISFQNWLQLSPQTETQQHEVDNIYIIPLQQLNLE